MPSSGPTPLVSAIVSTWNAESFLTGCLEDLEAQTLSDRLEIVVVDSGSEQDERSIVTRFQAEYHNVVYERTEERESIYAAWNRGIARASGVYVTNANTDDRHRRDALERMASELDARPDAALVYADVAITEQENATFEDAPVVGWFRWPEFSIEALFSSPCLGPQTMWRRELHDHYGVFDPSFRVAGDYEWWLRLAPTETFVHLAEVLGLYLLSPGSAERRDPELTNREAELARERHWPEELGERPALGGSYLQVAGGMLIRERERLIAEQERWIADLLKANAWLEGQVESWKELAEERHRLLLEIEERRNFGLRKLAKRAGLRRRSKSSS